MTSFVRSAVRLAAAVLVVSQLGAGVAAAQSADLSIEKWVFGLGGPVAAGAPFTYVISVFNFGEDAAQDVVVTDVLSAGMTFVSATVFPESSACSYESASNTVTCRFDEEEAFQGPFIELNVVAPATGGIITNTATVSSATPDPDPSNNTFALATDVVVFSLSDLAVTVTASAQDAVLVHRDVTFTPSVTNNGPEDAAVVALSLVPPSNADIISVTPSQGTCSVDSLGSYECLLGPLAAGASATVTMVVKPQTDGFALVSAFVSGDDDPQFFDPDSLNDFASAVVFVEYPGNADPSYPITSSQVVPYETFVANPCTEDVIYLSGYVHQVVSSTLNRNRFRTHEYTNFNDLTAVSLIDGTTYDVHGSTRTGSGRSLVFNPGLFPHEFTAVDTLYLVGGGETLQLHQSIHITINADGTVTSVADNPILECR